MNFQQFRNQLDELTQFFNYIEQRFGADDLSELDRELLQEYVRHLYKTTLPARSAATPKAATPAPVVKRPIELEISEHSMPPAPVAMPVVEPAEDVQPPVEIEAQPVVEAIATPLVKPLAVEVGTLAPSEETPHEDVAPPAVVPVVEELAMVEPAPAAVAEEKPANVVELSPAVEPAPVVVAEETQPLIIEEAKPESVVIVEQPAPVVLEIVETPAPVVVPEPIVEAVLVETVPPVVEEKPAAPAIESAMPVIVPPAPTTTETGVVVKATTLPTAQPTVETKLIINPVDDAADYEPRDTRFNEAYDELFSFKSASDLAQRLSETRIEDLSKALGLNEKYLYIGELFGGNAARFKQAIDYFNMQAQSLDDARLYMEGELIEQHGWARKEKRTLVRDFIKLVRRRYLK